MEPLVEKNIIPNSDSRIKIPAPVKKNSILLPKLDRIVLSYKCDDCFHSITMCPDCKIPDEFTVETPEETIIYKRQL